MLLENFGTYFFNILISLINGFINMLFSPIFNGINNVITSFFGNVLVSPVLLNFYDVLNDYVIVYIGYFTSIIPPLTWQVIVLGLDLFILVHAFELTFGLIFKALRLLKEFVPFA